MASDTVMSVVVPYAEFLERRLRLMTDTLRRQGRQQAQESALVIDVDAPATPADPPLNSSPVKSPYTRSQSDRANE